MILQALYDYYQRKAADPDSGIAPEGFEWKEIPFVVVIDREGRFVTFEDTREGEGKRKRAKPFLVPAAEKRTVGIKANLLWDNVEYALGANPRTRGDVAERHADFLRRLASDIAEHEYRDVLLKFLAAKPIAQIESDKASEEKWKEILETNSNILFRVEGSGDSSICDALSSSIRRSENESGGVCLVSGKDSSVARIHPSIKGVRDAQPAGAALVSFNEPAFRSYGKAQNHNAPVSHAATFAYTTALNILLGRDSKNKVQVGDASTLFWCGRKKTPFEEDFSFLWNVPPKDVPDRGIQAIETLLRSPFTGAGIPDGDIPFFVLGLSPNAGRVSVRFWYSGSIADVSKGIRKHFLDLEIIRPKHDKGNYALFYLLADIALENKVENIPPNLAGDVMRAILTGGPYPAMLLQQTIRRIRAKQDIKRTQAAILKACLNRQRRLQINPTEEEITVALDPANINPGYRLGRLFAALEKIQEDAQPGINATIRDRFYGAASSSPTTVFPQLLKLKNHHLAKLENPAFRTVHEKRLTEIFGGMQPDMPAHLSMEDQARFAVGYYHQRQAFFIKSEKPE